MFYFSPPHTIVNCIRVDFFPTSMRTPIVHLFRKKKKKKKLNLNGAVNLITVTHKRHHQFILVHAAAAVMAELFLFFIIAVYSVIDSLSQLIRPALNCWLAFFLEVISLVFPHLYSSAVSLFFVCVCVCLCFCSITLLLSPSVRRSYLEAIKI